MTGWRCEGVTIRRADRTLLDSVGVDFPAGKVTAVVGPNGSGKTTLLRVLAGLQSPDAGTVAGGMASGWREPEWARQVSCVFGALAEDLPYCVEEVLLSAWYVETGRWVEADEARRLRLCGLLDRLEVFADGARRGLDRDYASLSAGERQLVDLCRGLLQPTPVLLLDEPTSALDVRHRLLVRQVLRDEARSGRTVAASLHDLAEASAGVDGVCVLHRGSVAACGAPEVVLTPELLARVWGVRPSGGGYELL